MFWTKITMFWLNNSFTDHSRERKTFSNILYNLEILSTRKDTCRETVFKIIGKDLIKRYWWTPGQPNIRFLGSSDTSEESTTFWLYVYIIWRFEHEILQEIETDNFWRDSLFKLCFSHSLDGPRSSPLTSQINYKIDHFTLWELIKFHNQNNFSSATVAWLMG